MSTLFARALTVLALVVAMLAAPTHASAGGLSVPQDARPASKLTRFDKIMRKQVERMRVGSTTISYNVAWGLGAGALMTRGILHAEPITASVMGSVVAINAVQGVRKWLKAKYE